jgi:hypothetical protein
VPSSAPFGSRTLRRVIIGGSNWRGRAIKLTEQAEQRIQRILARHG